MAADKITYVDKVSLEVSALPDENVTRDSDMNEIKNKHNTNADLIDTNTAKVSFPEAPVDGTQYARKDAGWEAVAGGSIALENVLFVSPLGDNGTGTKGDPSKPYLTAAAAVTDAVLGDTVSFMPGSYVIGSNLAKNGVKFRTWGGLAELVSSVIIWDYSTEAVSTEDVDVRGDFNLEINGAGAGVYKAGASNNLNVLFNYKGLNQIQGTASFLTNVVCNNLSIIGEWQLIADGRYLQPSSGTTTAVVGFVKMNLVSNDALPPVFLACKNCYYVGTIKNTVGPVFVNGSSGSAQELSVNMTVSQPSGQLSTIPSGNYNVNWEGGQVDILANAITNIDGRFTDCTVKPGTGRHVLDGHYKDCIIFNNQATLILFKGVAEDCDIKMAGAPTTIWSGSGRNITFSSGSIGAFFKISGGLELADESRLTVSASQKLEITGILIGFRAGDLILHNSPTSSRVRISGQCINKRNDSAAARVYQANASLLNFDLDLIGAIMQAGAIADDTIKVPVTSTANFRLYNQSYVNIAPDLSGAITYEIGVAGDLITDSDVDVLT